MAEASKRTREQRARNGQCVRCGGTEDKEPHRRTCNTCSDQCKQRVLEARKRRKLTRTCVLCGHHEARDEVNTCHQCQQVVAERDRQYNQQKAELLLHYKRNGCVDCGLQDPRMLELRYRHSSDRPPLVRRWNRLTALSLRSLRQQEPALVVRCGNCVRRHWRASSHYHNNPVARMLNQLREQRRCEWPEGCVFVDAMVCGESCNPCLYQFDHLDPQQKRFNIMQADSWRQHSVAEILQEVAQCRVLCTNHHLLHSAQQRE